jgi:hypothetical protein
MWWLLIVIIILLNKDKIDSYTNYVEYPIKDCPKNYSQKLQKMKDYPKTIQPFGYTNREYFDKTRFVLAKEPLPVNADFFI